MEKLIAFIEHFILEKNICPFHALTGLYCPGCGGTRAFYAFIHGHFIQSFCLNPAVDYMAFAVIINIILFLRSKTKKIPYSFNAAWAWMFLIIVLGNFTIKLIASLNGIDLLAYCT